MAAIRPSASGRPSRPPVPQLPSGPGPREGRPRASRGFLLGLGPEGAGPLVDRLPSLGRIDILVCAFGPFVRKPLHETGVSDWERLALLDLALPGALASALVGAMAARGWGRFPLFSAARGRTLSAPMPRTRPLRGRQDGPWRPREIPGRGVLRPGNRRLPPLPGLRGYRIPLPRRTRGPCGPRPPRQPPRGQGPRGFRRGPHMLGPAPGFGFRDQPGRRAQALKEGPCGAPWDPGEGAVTPLRSLRPGPYILQAAPGKADMILKWQVPWPFDNGIDLLIIYFYNSFR